MKASWKTISGCKLFFGRQEQDASRYEKILATWEEQQKAYQAYLDSLNHPR